MNRNVIVTVENKQIIGNDEEKIELCTPGKFYKKDNTYYIEYNETQISGMEGTTTTLEILKDQVRLVRTGTTDSVLNFKKGITDISLYGTPYGYLELSINPTIVDIDVNDDNCNIRLVYELETQKHKVSINELYVSIKG